MNARFVPWSLLGALALLTTAPAGAAERAPAAPPPAAPGAPAGSEKLSRLLAAADEAWRERDRPGRVEEMKAALDEAERIAPDGYGVLWRISRWYFWVADDPKLAAEEKSRLGKLGWDFGDRATRASPEGVEGWFYAMSGVGNYSLGIGVVTALLKGIDGKFVERLERAQKIDPDFDRGGVDLSWGRYFYELPWPKYDGRRSEVWLYKALGKNPKNVRARVYLAELYLKEDHPPEARRQLERALAHEPGAYDAPEERRYQARARELLAGMKP